MLILNISFRSRINTSHLFTNWQLEEAKGKRERRKRKRRREIDGRTEKGNEEEEEDITKKNRVMTKKIKIVL